MPRAEQTRPSLVFNTTVKAPPEAVFDAFFGTPERWFCRQSDVDPRVGGRIRLCWPDGCVEGQFLQVERPSTGRFSWRFEGDTLPQTTVVVWVQPGAQDEGTADVEVEHYGFGVGPEWDLAYVGAARAWAGYLKNLRAMLEAGLDLREAGE